MAIFDEIRDRKATIGIAGGVLLVALVIIWSQTKSDSLPINHTLLFGIGQVVATETATAVRDHGQIMAVISENCTVPGAAQFDAWQAFQRELKEHHGITLLQPVNAKFDPNDFSPDCPSVFFKNLMEQNADVDAIVFFVSLPDWNRLELSHRVPQRLPPQVIVLDTGPLPAQGYYNGYFANGYVSVLIAARRSAAVTKPGGPRTEREWFDQYFQVFTPANLESLN